MAGQSLPAMAGNQPCAMPSCANEATPGLKLCGQCRGEEGAGQPAAVGGRTKKCSKCLKEKDVERFSKKSSAPDGLQYWCKDCVKEHGSSHTTSIVAGAATIQPESPPATKICKTCGKEKDLKEFYRNSQAEDGREGNCKECRAGHKSTTAKTEETDGGETAISTAALIDEGQTEKPDYLTPIVRRLAPLVTEHLKGDFAATALLIDMSAYPDLLAEIKRRAIDEDRTPEAQARWLLRRIIAQEEMKEIAA